MANKKPQPVLANDLRIWFKDKIKSNYDYSLATNRKQDIEDFISVHQSKYPQELKLKQVRASANPILDSCIVEAGIDPESLGRTRTNKKTGLKFNSDMNAKIQPSPQAGDTDTTPKKINQNDPNQLQQGLGIIQQVETFSKEAVSASFAGLYLTLKIAFPDIESLSEEEKKSLGELWHGAFNLYISNEKMAVIGIPLISTLGMFLPKIIEARKKAKIRKSAKEGNLVQKEIDQKNETKQKEIDLIKTENIVVPPENNKPTIGSYSTEILPKKENEKSDSI